MSDNLIQRLRGIYTIPVNDGAGLLDGKDTFTRTFQTPPIMHEADDALAAERAKVALLQSLLRMWAALDAGDWHILRHAREKEELLDETRAALRETGGGE